MWVWVARWIKKENNQEELRQDAKKISNHWREVALDVGFDPDKNVTVEEGDRQIRVGISEEMDMEFREGPGGWRSD